MTKINDLTIEELIKVAESGELTFEQERKVKAYAITRLKSEVGLKTITTERKAELNAKIAQYQADIYGVMDMGYPYVKTDSKERAVLSPSSHVDMYCASEPLE